MTEHEEPDLHERMACRINEARDRSPQGMRSLMAEFPDARVSDWACAFCMTPSPDYGGEGPLIQLIVDVQDSFPEITLDELIEAWLAAKRFREARSDRPL